MSEDRSNRGDEPLDGLTLLMSGGLSLLGEVLVSFLNSSVILTTRFGLYQGFGDQQ